MKCTIPEISWHNREPVLSVDIFPVINNFYRLASGGGDCHVLIWQMTISENGAVKQELVSDLTRHQRTVNVVRWSPNGSYLATADDDANIIIWQQKSDNIPLLDEDSIGSESWISYKVLRGHKEDIYDLCWSPDSLKLFTGSIDNTAILWDLQKGKTEQILTDHKGFVQGVTWDPKNQYVATISTDRVCRVFDVTGKQVKCRISKGFLPVPEGHQMHKKETKYFHDDTFKSFFRRLTFTPDGSLLVAPSGKIELDESKNSLNVTYLFAVDMWTQPVAILPCPNQSSTVVRCCPLLFELKEDGPDAAVSLPYRMVIAVGTDRDIILYDTQQLAPFARFRDVHYTRLTDLSWSPDGRLLIASSTDGFCSLITFDADEIGTPYSKEESEQESVLDISGCEEVEIPKKEKEAVKEVAMNVDTPRKKDDAKAKRASFLEEWTRKSAKKAKLDESNQKRMSTQAPEDPSKKKDGNINKLIPKRIVPITISTSKCDNTSTNEQKSDKVCDSSINIPQEMKPVKRIIPTPVNKSDKEADKTKHSSSEAKPIEVRRKPKSESVPNKEQSTIKECKVVVTPLCPLQDALKSNEVKPIKAASIKSDNKVVNKKINPSKPIPKNSLLKFFSPKDSSVKVKRKSKNIRTQLFDKSDNAELDCVLIQDDEVAMDAWKCERTASASTSVDTSLDNRLQHDDDVTEEFSLQLEDSQQDIKATETRDEEKAVNKHAHSGVTLHLHETLLTGNEDIAGNNIKKGEKENLINDIEQKQDIETEDRSEMNDDVAPSKPLLNRIVPKVNRIPLITLSSPKDKKKEKS